MSNLLKYTAAASMVLAFLAGCDGDGDKKTPSKPSVEVRQSTAAPAAKPAEPAKTADAAKDKAAADGKSLDLGSPLRNYSYALGSTVGEGLQQNIKVTKEMGVDFDVESLKQGFIDGLSGKSRMSKDDVQKNLQALDNEVRTKAEAKEKAEKDANLKAGQEFLAKNAKAEGVKVTSSGLQYRVNVQGTGDKVTSNDDVVSVFYTGKLISGKVFDTNETEGKTALEFPVGGVIPGWQEGIKLMTVGSDYDFFIPSELAYRDQKLPGNLIPPNSTLIFHVRLVGVKHAGAAEPAAAGSKTDDAAKKAAEDADKKAAEDAAAKKAAADAAAKKAAEDAAQKAAADAAAAKKAAEDAAKKAAEDAAKKAADDAAAEAKKLAEESAKAAADAQKKLEEAQKAAEAAGKAAGTLQDTVKQLPAVDADAANF